MVTTTMERVCRSCGARFQAGGQGPSSCLVCDGALENAMAPADVPGFPAFPAFPVPSPQAHSPQAHSPQAHSPQAHAEERVSRASLYQLPVPTVPSAAPHTAVSLHGSIRRVGRNSYPLMLSASVDHAQSEHPGFEHPAFERPSLENIAELPTGLVLEIPAMPPRGKRAGRRRGSVPKWTAVGLFGASAVAFIAMAAGALIPQVRAPQAATESAVVGEAVVAQPVAAQTVQELPVAAPSVAAPSVAAPSVAAPSVAAPSVAEAVAVAADPVQVVAPAVASAVASPTGQAAPQPKVDAEDLMHQAEGFLSQGDRASAAESYTKILRKNPDYLPALRGLADVRWDLGQIEAAVKLYKRYEALAPAAGSNGRSKGLGSSPSP
jgi:hypothetical protein